MAYNTTDSVPRQDISTLLMEAVHQEQHYIGQSVLPIYGSERQFGRYPKFRIGKGELLKKESQKRNATGTYNESEETFEWDSYNTEEYGHEKRVDDVVRKQMKDFFDAEMVTAKFCMNKLMLDYEAQVAGAIMNSSNFTAASSTTAYTEANLATIDFPQDVNAALEQLTLVGEQPNTMILTLQVFNRLKRSKLLQTYLYGFLNTTQGGSNITTQIIAEAFGVQNVVIAKKSYDTAIKGKGPTVVPIWGNDYVWIGDVQGGDFMNAGAGRTIIWDADSEGGLFTTDQYRDEARRGDKIRVRSNRTVKIINPNAGRLITTQWS
jgi:hypothetical protein